VSAAAQHPMVPRPFNVRAIRRESYDTFTLELQSEQAGEFGFAPGQFNMLYVFGVGEVPISISGDPTRPKKLVHTTREVGAVTRAMRQCKPGGALGVRGPFGSHWPVESVTGADLVIVAGGIGLAPLRPALYHVLANRKRYGNVFLLYGTRTPADILFQKQLQQWQNDAKLPVYITVDRAAGDWRGSVGVVTTLIPRVPFEARNAAAFICGPEVMMRFTARELQRRGIEPQNIHISMERNMKCAVGFCGHCQLGPTFICKDGPVFTWAQMEPLMRVREM
jgi:NAD(P)H-flavin reductase